MVIRSYNKSQYFFYCFITLLFNLKLKGALSSLQDKRFSQLPLPPPRTRDLSIVYCCQKGKKWALMIYIDMHIFTFMKT